MSKGSCYGIPKIMYPERSNSQVQHAKNICKGSTPLAISACPVRDECLAYALEHNEKFGVWGGTSERERRRLQRQRRSGVTTESKAMHITTQRVVITQDQEALLRRGKKLSGHEEDDPQAHRKAG